MISADLRNKSDEFSGGEWGTFEYILLPSLSQDNLLPYVIVFLQRAQGVETQTVATVFILVFHLFCLHKAKATSSNSHTEFVHWFQSNSYLKKIKNLRKVTDYISELLTHVLYGKRDVWPISVCQLMHMQKGEIVPPKYMSWSVWSSLFNFVSQCSKAW